MTQLEGAPAPRRSNSHLSWCRLLVIAYGSVPAADRALLGADRYRPQNRTSFRACDWVENLGAERWAKDRSTWRSEHGGKKPPHLIENYAWAWAVGRPSCGDCQILEDAAREFRAECDRERRERGKRDVNNERVYAQQHQGIFGY